MRFGCIRQIQKVFASHDSSLDCASSGQLRQRHCPVRFVRCLDESLKLFDIPAQPLAYRMCFPAHL